MDAPTLATAMGCTRAVADRYVVDFNIALLAAQCTTVNRAAMFCAQVGHESAGLRYMEEIASGAAYEGRRDLGNTQPGDGRRFKGRGPIQLTGRHNYGLFSRWAHAQGLVASPDYFVRNPAVVATSRWGFLAASWYWTVARPRLNAQADAGDLVAATRSINGGTNGLADRRVRWNRCRGLGTRVLPARSITGPAGVAAPPPPPPVRRPRGDHMFFQTPAPPEDTPKWEWPTIRIPFAFDVYDPAHSWGGNMILKVDHGGNGGWIHLARWWVRVPDWTPNRPVHVWQDHPLGSAHGHAGSERFVGYGWQTSPPLKADMIELVLSAPDGVHIRDFYEK